MVEFALRGDDEDLARCVCMTFTDDHPLHRIRESHQPVTLFVELVYQPTAAQSFFFLKGEVHDLTHTMTQSSILLCRLLSSRCAAFCRRRFSGRFRGCFSGCFSSFFGGLFSGHFSSSLLGGLFSGHFGGLFRGHFSSLFGSLFSGHFGGHFSDRFGSLFGGLFGSFELFFGPFRQRGRRGGRPLELSSLPYAACKSPCWR